MTLSQKMIALALAAGTAGMAQAAPPKAKISVAQARKAALRAIPGKVVSSQYEHEDGRWQYAVVVSARKGGWYEVEVSSTTGKILDTEKTSAREEAQEAAADRKAAGK